jgi:hypothetical protein
MSNAEADALKAREQQDGFIISPDSDEQVFLAHGHVDKVRFLEQLRWLCREWMGGDDFLHGVDTSHVLYLYVQWHLGESGERYFTSAAAVLDRAITDPG